jgi:YesN/AraC family two-component response regulator
MYKVLLVEDEVFVRESVREIIDWEKWGFTVVGEAGNGAEALEFIKREKPHLVITDIIMPEMDGIELLRRTREAGLAPKFVMLTCMNDLKYAIQAMEYGASSYILKLSMSVSDLRNTLNKVSGELKEQERESRQHVRPQPSDGDVRIPWDREKEFYQAFENRNAERCSRLICAIWDAFSRDGAPLEAVRSAAVRLAATCHRIAEQPFDAGELDGPATAGDLRAWLADTVERLIARMAEQKGELTSHPEINKIIAYIQQHYEQDITVKMMARYVIMSENYVSALFRKKTGKNLISYLHEVRIRKAKEYIETTDLPINEIGRLVGFVSDNYFIRIFKRFTKMTPSQYRERHQKPIAGSNA